MDNKRRSNIYLPLYFRRSESLPLMQRGRAASICYARQNGTPHWYPEQGEDSSRVHFQEGRGRQAPLHANDNVFNRAVVVILRLRVDFFSPR